MLVVNTLDLWRWYICDRYTKEWDHLEVTEDRAKSEYSPTGNAT